MQTDIEIAQAANLQTIQAIAQKLGLGEDELELYGKFKAKITRQAGQNQAAQTGKLILVTAMNPTKAGEGKTTVSIGLADALTRLGQKTVLALREPSLGPVLGLKGGACGGGYAQVVPMEDINLHFTGDLHAVTAAHNLISALIDNHIFQGNQLRIDSQRIVWPHVLDMNDRALRQVMVGGDKNGVAHQASFDITAASEVMAILCLSKDLIDFKQKIAQIVVAYDLDGKVITAGDLKAEGAVAVLMKDAIKPNLVQTLEGTPALLHGGPFANIAHGCNSLIATKLGLELADLAVTEAGFGADLGAEKFFDLKCVLGELRPAAVVLVATIQALKINGGVDYAELKQENLAALRAGFVNLKRHIENIRKFGLEPVVALNKFASDSPAELALVEELVGELSARLALTEVFTRGGAGGEALAQAVLEQLATDSANFQALYQHDLPILDKIQTVAREIYRADSIKLSQVAEEQLARLNEQGYGQLPICIAKTQYSFSDDQTKLGAPSDYQFNVRELRLSAGAGFVVVVAGAVMTMPGLPPQPAACQIDIDERGMIKGLF